MARPGALAPARCRVAVHGGALALALAALLVGRTARAKETLALHDDAALAQLASAHLGAAVLSEEAVVLCDEPEAASREPACATLLRALAARALPDDARAAWERVPAVRLRVGFARRLVRAVDGGL